MSNIYLISKEKAIKYINKDGYEVWMSQLATHTERKSITLNVSNLTPSEVEDFKLYASDYWTYLLKEVK